MRDRGDDDPDARDELSWAAESGGELDRAADGFAGRVADRLADRAADRLADRLAGEQPSPEWVDRTETALLAHAERLRAQPHAGARKLPWVAGAVLAVASLVLAVVLVREDRLSQAVGVVDRPDLDLAAVEEGYLPGFGTLPGAQGYVRLERR